MSGAGSLDTSRTNKPSRKFKIFMLNQAHGEHLKNVCGEFLDGFLLVGFSAANGKPMIMLDVNDPKTALAINAILVDLLQQGLLAEE